MDAAFWGSQSQPKELLSVTTGQTSPQPRGRVLVADDEAAVRHVLREMLLYLGYEPVVVEDGRSAISVLTEEAQTFKLLVCDMTMPHRSGLEVLQYAGLVAPELPAIITTGYDDWNHLEELSLSNLIGVLPKPFGVPELRGMLETRLDKEELIG